MEKIKNEMRQKLDTEIYDILVEFSLSGIINPKADNVTQALYSFLGKIKASIDKYESNLVNDELINICQQLISEGQPATREGSGESDVVEVPYNLWEQFVRIFMSKENAVLKSE